MSLKKGKIFPSSPKKKLSKKSGNSGQGFVLTILKVDKKLLQNCQSMSLRLLYYEI